MHNILVLKSEDALFMNDWVNIMVVAVLPPSIA